MATTRAALNRISTNVEESMGVRASSQKVQFGPVASSKDIGRVPLRTFGQIEIDRVMPDPGQPRSQFDSEEIQRLADSIESKGQLHPIRVRWSEGDDKWIIVAGERRWRATRAAGLSSIACYFIDDTEVSASEILEQQLVENLLREDLRPLEEARAYAALMELNQWNGKQVAASLHVSPSKVSRCLALLDLPDDVQRRIDSGELPRTAAYELSKLKNESVQRDLAEQASAGTLNLEETTKAVRQRKGKRSQNRSGIHQTFYAENGLKITVTATRDGTYHDIAEALSQASDEVQLRINNRVQL